jgi:hypothetical protein
VALRLLLLLLELLLELSLSKQFCLVLLLLLLLCLHRLNPHHLELNHLHLHLGLGHHVGSETRAEWHAVGVHAPGGLVMREAIGGPVYGGGHKTIPSIEYILLDHLSNVVVFLLFREEIGGVRRGETRDVEGANRSRGVGNIGRGGTDATCAEASEKRSAIARVCGCHCFGGVESEWIDKEQSITEDYWKKVVEKWMDRCCGRLWIDEESKKKDKKCIFWIC